ncbi:amino acid permease [Neokomagataea anthophila]|nr:amino acid permease [Neokomagataea anthophila]
MFENKLAFLYRPLRTFPSTTHNGFMAIIHHTSHENAPTGTLQDRHVTMIALGGVIGAGLFVGSSASIALAGPAVLLAYAATGLLVVIVMRLLGEMLLARPGIGSFVDCVRVGCGPAAGFVAGWLYWFFWAIVIGAEAIAGAIAISEWVALPVWVIAIGLIITVNLLNLISVRLFGECEFWLSLIKVICVLGFCALGLAALLHFVGPPPSVVHNLNTGGGPVPHGIFAVLTAIPSVLFSMIGSESATVAAAETKDAGGNIAKVTRSTGLRIMVFYLLSVALILCLVPWTNIHPGHSPFVTAMETIGIPGAPFLMKVVILSAVISCLNSSIYITSRTLQGLAARKDAPSWFAKLSKQRLPQRAIAGCSLFGLIVAGCSILSPDVLFAFLLGASGAVILVVYALVICAHRSLRDEQSALFVMPRWISTVSLIGIAVVIIGMLYSASGRSTLFASTLSVIVFYAAYRIKEAVQSQRT